MMIPLSMLLKIPVSFGSVIWHARLGYIGQDRLKRLARASLLGSFVKVELPICEHCFAGKTTRLPFGKAKKATSKL